MLQCLAPSLGSVISAGEETEQAMNALGTGQPSALQVDRQSAAGGGFGGLMVAATEGDEGAYLLGGGPHRRVGAFGRARGSGHLIGLIRRRLFALEKNAPAAVGPVEDADGVGEQGVQAGEVDAGGGASRGIELLVGQRQGGLVLLPGGDPQLQRR